jgi:hypothetical protein
MRPGLPRTSAPVVQDGKQPMDRDWYRYFRDTWTALGFGERSPVYSDLWVDGHAMYGAAPATVTINGGFEGVQCPAATLEERFFTFRLPNDYTDGTEVAPYFEWVPRTAAAGNVVWLVEYTIGKSGAAFGVAVSEQVTEAAPGVAFQVKRKVFTEIAGTGLVKGSLLACTLSRLGADAADTFAESAILLGCGLKYQIEGIGHERAHP